MRDWSCTMETHVVEAAECVAVPKYDDRVVADFRREKLPRLHDLVDPTDELPCVCEHALALELEKHGIDIQPRGNRRGSANVRVERKDQRHLCLRGARTRRASLQ